MPAYQAGADWKDRHNAALVKAIVSLVMANRSTLYADPDLLEVANNGGDRINKKTQQFLRKLIEGVPGAEGALKEALANKSKGTRSSPATPKSSGKRSVNGRGGRVGGDDEPATPTSPPKKRKVVKKEIKDESDDFESE